MKQKRPALTRTGLNLYKVVLSLEFEETHSVRSQAHKGLRLVNYCNREDIFTKVD